MKVYIVQEAVDLGYSVVGVYAIEDDAKKHVAELVSNHKYPSLSPSHYIYEEWEVSTGVCYHE